MVKQINKTTVVILLLAGAFMLSAEDAPAATEPASDSKQAVRSADSVSEIMKSVQVPLKANDPDRPKMGWSGEARSKLNLKGTDSTVATVGQKKEQMTLTPPSGTGPGVWRLLGGFAAMGLLIWGLYLILKKYGRKITGQTDDAKLKILKRISVDQKNSIVLVKCYEDEILLGVNSTGGLILLNKYKQIDIAEDESTAMAEQFDEEDELTDEQVDKYVDLKISSLTAKELNRMKEENK